MSRGVAPSRRRPSTRSMSCLPTRSAGCGVQRVLEVDALPGDGRRPDTFSAAWTAPPRSETRTHPLAPARGLRHEPEEGRRRPEEETAPRGSSADPALTVHKTATASNVVPIGSKSEEAEAKGSGLGLFDDGALFRTQIADGKCLVIYLGHQLTKRSRHDDLTNLTLGERPRADHPALVRVCRFAGKHFLPMSIHHNIAPISRNPTEIQAPLYLDELVRLFRHCRWKDGDRYYIARLIWCHAGISRRINIENLPFWIEAVLKDSEDQVSIDLSWVILADYIYKDLDRWVRMIRQYPDRFVIGSDAVGAASKLKQELSNFDPLLAKLHSDIRAKVPHANFANLMQEMATMRAKAGLGDEGIVLDYRYECSEYGNTGRLSKSESFTRSREEPE